MTETRPATAELVESDREHGSAWISLRALEALRDRAAALASRTGETGETGERVARPELLAFVRRLIAARPAMAAPANRVRRALAAALSAAGDSGGRDFAAALERAAAEAIEDARAADRAAAGHAAARVAGRRVLALSRSGTVEEALRSARPRPRVVVAESRPGGEGIGVAARLREAGVEARVVSDTAVAWAIAECGIEAVVVGADTVLPSGAVINKIGTLAAALAARAAGVPLWAVAARDKVAPRPLDPPAELAAREALPGDPGFALEVPLFEQVPAEWVTAVITEDGPLDAGGVAAVARAAAERVRTLEETLGSAGSGSGW